MVTIRMQIKYYTNSQDSGISLNQWEDRQCRLWKKRVDEIQNSLPMVNTTPYLDRVIKSGIVGAGTYGRVYNDPDQEGFVVKIWSDSVDYLTVVRECNAFQRYYKNKHAYVTLEYFGGMLIKPVLHMLRLTGIPLNQLSSERRPKNSKECWRQMEQHLRWANVTHLDMAEQNILYDPDDSTIDPQNGKPTIYKPFDFT